MQLQVNFTDDISLIYNLINHQIVDSWVEILNTRTINDLCPFNHYIGYSTDELITAKINRLYELADLINMQTPERVIKVEITRENYQTAINTMHVHFPLLKNDVAFKHVWDILSEYNDIIHWLESTIKLHWSVNHINESRMFRITLDFNKSDVKFKEIPEDAFILFDPNTLFGELKLHYTHVGRHAQELFMTNDVVCPPEQFIPQRLFTASVRMHFTDDYYIDQEKWKMFYHKRGADFWNIDLTDPKLAFGYIKIGQLSSIDISGVRIPFPTNTASRHEFRKRLVKTKVIGWEIK